MNELASSNIGPNLWVHEQGRRACGKCGVDFLIKEKFYSINDQSTAHYPECPKLPRGAITAPTGHPTDPINPPHYQGDYVMRIIEDFKLNFRVGNVVKYCLRADNKNQLEDLNKALWYLQREIDRRGEENK